MHLHPLLAHTVVEEYDPTVETENQRSDYWCKMGVDAVEWLPFSICYKVA
jgi:hypothetical protein